MDSFFTPAYTLEPIALAWATRKKELHQLRLEQGRDVLLETLKTHCTIHRARLYEELLDAAKHANHISHLRIPIWDYKAVNVRCDPVRYQTEINRAQSLGLDAVTRINLGGDVVRTQSIVHQTDFLQRLSAYFGPDFQVCVEKEPHVEGWSEAWESHTRTLVLKYRPTRKVPQTPPPASPQSSPPPVIRRPARHTSEDLQEVTLDTEPRSCYCYQP